MQVIIHDKCFQLADLPSSKLSACLCIPDCDRQGRLGHVDGRHRESDSALGQVDKLPAKALVLVLEHALVHALLIDPAVLVQTHGTGHRDTVEPDTAIVLLIIMFSPEW